MRRNRRITVLDEEERAALRQLYRQAKNADLRTHCQMVLLSAQGNSVSEIAELTLFDENSVLYWFDRYEAEGLAGLEERPRPGRPPKLRRTAPDGNANLV